MCRDTAVVTVNRRLCAHRGRAVVFCHTLGLVVPVGGKQPAGQAVDSPHHSEGSWTLQPPIDSQLWLRIHPLSLTHTHMHTHTHAHTDRRAHARTHAQVHTHTQSHT